MIRGMRTEFVFEMPYHYVNLQSVTIEFWQENHNGLSYGYTLPIIKTLAQCYPKSNPMQIGVILSSDETLRFTDDRRAYVRFSGVKNNGHEFGGNKEEFSVYPASDGSLLEEDLLPAPDYNGWNYINWHEGE